MHPITTTFGRRFEAQETESLLDAALRQGVVLDHSCRTGRCSSCKGRVVSGDTVASHDELGLPAEDRAAGYVLTCVRQARGPVLLEMADLGDCGFDSLVQGAHVKLIDAGIPEWHFHSDASVCAAAQ